MLPVNLDFFQTISMIIIQSAALKEYHCNLVSVIPPVTKLQGVRLCTSAAWEFFIYKDKGLLLHYARPAFLNEYGLQGEKQLDLSSVSGPQRINV